MAEMNFLGFKEVTKTYFEGLTQAQKVGYVWFVKADTEAESDGDIYLGARHYGQFKANDSETIKQLEEALNTLSGQTVVIEDKVSELIDNYNELAETVENLDSNDIILGDEIKVDGKTVAESGDTVNEVLNNIYQALNQGVVKAGSGITVSGSTVSVKISSDEGNMIKQGSDGGIFAGLYYECESEEDIEKTE